MDQAIEPTAPTRRPREATRAVQLISASFILGAIRAAFELTQKVAGVYILPAMLLLLVFFGICFFFVSKIAAGRNWARIIFLILVLLGLPFAIIGYIQELRLSLLGGSFSIIVALLQVIGTCLLFTGNSNVWFRKRK
jgi:hypothetical protein